MAVRFAAIEQFALSLPGTSAAPHFHFGSWRVGAQTTAGGKTAKPGKIFVTLPPGNTVLHVFVPEAQREQIFILYPDCTEKLFWGEKVCGVRVLLDKAALAEVKTWVKAAWAHNGGEKWVARQVAAADKDVRGKAGTLAGGAAATKAGAKSTQASSALPAKRTAKSSTSSAAKPVPRQPKRKAGDAR